MNENKKNEKLGIYPTEIKKFDGDMKTMLISSVEASKIANGLLRPAFHDLAGCTVKVNDGSDKRLNSIIPIGKIYLEVYFRDNGDCHENEGMKNIIFRNAVDNRDTNGDTKSLKSRYFAVTSSSNTTGDFVYKVTKDTYEILDEFFIKPGNGFNYSMVTYEFHNQMAMIGSKENITVCVTALNLDKILGRVYGTETDEGKFEYQTSFATSIPNSKEFIIQVTQLNLAAVRKLQRELGVYTPSNNMYTPC